MAAGKITHIEIFSAPGCTKCGGSENGCPITEGIEHP